MQIEVVASVNEARSEDLAGRTVLVIDVLRATSNIVTGLAHGVTGITPVETVQQAKSLQAPGDLLGGERHCRKLAGFDLGNSPFEYLEKSVSGKRIIMTTTNGTRAIQKASKAQTVLACSLLNVTACAEAALAIGRDVTVLCSGTQDVFSLEDGLCAGMVTEELVRLAGRERLEIGDFGLAMAACYRDNRHRLKEALLTCSNGKRLIRLGFQPDIEYCAEPNRYSVVPVLADGTLISYCAVPKHQST